MGNILRFVVRNKAMSKANAASGAGRRICEIVIFPGVRYERWSGDAEKPHPRVKRRRSRRIESTA